MEAILAQLIGGAAGGTAGGKLVKDADLGNIGNLIAGGIGGVGGGQLLGALLGGAAGDAAAGFDIAALAGQLVGVALSVHRPSRRRHDQEQAYGPFLNQWSRAHIFSVQSSLEAVL